MKNHLQVIKDFVKGKTGRGCNVYSEGNKLYSYGPHFPLIVRRDSGTEREWFLLNGDKYSKSTSKHQSLTYRVFVDYPRVSFTAIKAAGINYDSCKLVDFWKDEYDFCDDPTDWAFKDFEKHIPIGAEYHVMRDTDGTIISKSYHKVGSVVLEENGKYFLCSMDEQSYFVSLLPHKVNSVKEAFDSLKPEKVKESLASGVDVKRQGEWFFIPVTIKIKEKDFDKKAALPSADSSSNQHVCTRLKKIGEQFFVKGIVRHVNPRTNRKADHKPLKLGDGIYEAVCNTAKGNWSAAGNVD